MLSICILRFNDMNDEMIHIKSCITLLTLDRPVQCILNYDVLKL